MRRLLLIYALVIVVAGPAAADDKHKGHAGTVAEKAYGLPGKAADVTRTIEVGMSDTMRYSPSEISVKRGETIRFVFRNTGKVEHEFVLGTAKELKAHADAMRKNPKMEHGLEANAVDVDAGKQGELVWRFTKAGTFTYGCLVPGHFEAGMVGKLVVN